MVRRLGNVVGVATTTATVDELTPAVFTSTAEAGALANLSVATQPSDAAVTGVPFDRQPVIQAEDGTGQPAEAGVTVTVTADGATLAGDTEVATDETGVARFTDLALTGADGTYTLTFSATGYVSAQSSPVALASEPVESDRLAITTQPAEDAENGVALTRQPVVRAEDADGNPLGAGIAVTARPPAPRFRAT